ncbi:MAG: choice-of-anchor Q domain-containing protein [Lacibacter sp.]
MKYFLFFLCIATSGQVSSQNLFVDSSISVPGKGGSWQTAYNSLSDALDSAMQNPLIEKIFVAKGTYFATKFPYQIGTNQKGTQINSVKNKEKLFHVRMGLEIFGGFPNGGGTQNITQNPTILTAAKVGGVLTDTAYHVIYVTNYRWTKANDTTRIDGFIIRDAKATTTTNAETYLSLNYGGLIHNYGAGLYIAMNEAGSSNVCVISNNTITNNFSTRSAAGIVFIAGDIVVNNNIISNNTASNTTNDNCDGVGILVNSSNFLITKNLFSNNTSSKTGYGFGSGLFLSYATGKVEKNIFENNSSVMSAGALGIGSSISSPSFVVIDGNYFIKNKANSAGGAIYISVGNTSITNNVFYGNEANGSVSFANGGGAILTSVSKNFIANNTFVGNATTSFGGAIYTAKNDTNNIVNNIFWGNTKNGVNNVSGADYQNSSVYNCVNTFTNNLLQLPAGSYSISNLGIYSIGSASNGNIFGTDPLFKDIASITGLDGVYRNSDDGLTLQSNSGCINTGSNSYISSIPFDIKGDNRVQGNVVDIGAYESFQYTTSITDPQNPNMPIRISPNPANQLISLSGLITSKRYAYYLTDYTGKVLIKGNIQNTNQLQININTMPSGVYLLRLYNMQQGKLMGTEKIIVVR